MAHKHFFSPALAMSLLVFSSVCFGQLRKIDSLRKVLATDLPDTMRVHVLNDFSHKLSLTGNFDSGKIVVNESILLAQKVKFKKGIADAFYTAGIAYSTSDQPQAIKYYSRARDVYKSISNEKSEASCLRAIGLCYMQTSDYELALQHFLSALQVAEHAGSLSRMAEAMNGISDVHRIQKNYSKALEYINRALEIEKKQSTNKTESGRTLGAKAMIFFDMNQQDSCRYYSEKAYAIYERTGENYQLLNELYVMARSYLQDVNHHEIAVLERKTKCQLAIDKLQRGVALAESMNAETPPRIGALYDGLTQAYMLIEDAPKALWYAEKALDAARKSRSAQQIINSSLLLAQAYEGVNQYKKAAENWREAFVLNDSLIGAQAGERFARMQTEFETEKKDNQIALLSKDKAIQAALLRNTQKNRNMIIAALLGLFLFSGTVYYFKRQKKELVLQHKITETELNLFRSQMNPHFMFNALNSIHSYVMVNEKQHAVKYLQKFSQLMRMILENSTSKSVTLADDLRALDLYLELEAERLGHKFAYEIKVQEGLETNKIMVPPLILQPFLENSIWHGMQKMEKGGRIQLQVNTNGELLECVITDNGKGFQKSEGNSQNGERKSYGINITRQRIENLNRTSGVKGYCNVTEMFDGNRLPAGVKVEVGLPLELEG